MSKTKSAPSTKGTKGFLDKVMEPVEESAREIQKFHAELGDPNSKRLLGYVMELGYDNAVLVTNDFYKIRAGGISKNSFLLIRPESLHGLIAPEDLQAFGGADNQPAHLILARVREPAPTPLATDIARTYFEMHKSHMPELDVFTKSELQWGAVKVTVLGTFFDNPQSQDIEFGGDIQTFLSPHMYSVYVPTATMMERLINYNVDRQPIRKKIGWIRLTESLLRPPPPEDRVPVRVSPSDFIGARTALFGKTRMGKSNTVKVIAQMILDSGVEVGQVIFDLNGEYAYTNPQDKTSIYDLYKDRCERYTLRPNPDPGVKFLKADFYRDLALGHQIIRDLFRQDQGMPPDYMKPFFDFEVLDDEEVKKLEQDDRGAATRYKRHISMYYCILKQAGFDMGTAIPIQLHLNKAIRAAIAASAPGLATTDSDGVDRVPDRLNIDDAIAAFENLWDIYDPDNAPFRTPSGRPYLDSTAESMLTMLTGKARGCAARSGSKKLVPYKRYHATGSGKLLRSIVFAVEAGKTVIIDLSNAPQELTRFFGDLVSQAIFKNQMDLFTSNDLGEKYVQFYFEEAHNLFPKDDRDLTSIYNRLAKEGAKLNIGLIYSTQSIESLSPDLLKNTENFFIAHLNDEREIKALTRFHEFRDVGPDVQRTKARGFVRAITSSHKFAIPVQIRKFGPPE